MTAYRFCRTDDIDLLVEALNHCWSPYFPDEPPMTPAAFKRSIRDLQVWCSSCMVAFSGPDPIGVLIGAKRPSGTLVHKIAVHPDHWRQGHGRHLLASLGSKLAILGPPRIVAEIPETRAPACELFRSSGYVQESLLTDYVWQPGLDAHEVAEGRFVIPITVDDLAANGLLEAHPQVCWERSVETLTARKDDIAGLAVASEERIESYVLYLKPEAGPRESANPPPFAPGRQPELRRDFAEAGAEAAPPVSPETTGIVGLRTFVEDGGAGLKQLLARLRGRDARTVRFPKVHEAEASCEFLESLGFCRAGGHRLYVATPRPS